MESSPAAIFTLDHRGVVLAANRAAESLFAIPEEQALPGRVIASYLPLLSDALHIKVAAEGFRTAAQCYGRREDGEVFLANTWFSTYPGPEGTHLAAIVVDSVRGDARSGRAEPPPTIPLQSDRRGRRLSRRAQLVRRDFHVVCAIWPRSTSLTRMKTSRA